MHPAFCCSHLKKIGWPTCSLAGMSSLGRSGRCIHTADTRPTGRSHGKSRRVSQKTDPRKNRERRRNRPTPGFSAMGNRHGKPQQKPYGKPRSGVCFVHECFFVSLFYLSLRGPSAERAERSPVSRHQRSASPPRQNAKNVFGPRRAGCAGRGRAGVWGLR